jgi:tripartite-type tricarboxylate transporter receptor subunit TctC
MQSRVKILFAAFACTVLGLAHAQSYPDKPIKLIVPYPAGGSTDIVGRTIGQKLSEQLGQPVVIDNRAGASGTIGAGVAAKSPADGYTLLLAAGAHAVGEVLNANLSYNLVRDFDAVSLVAKSGYLLVLGPSVPANSVSELISLAKSKPGKLNFASTGQGSTPQLAALLFCSMTDTKMTDIPYKGDAPALVDLVGGRVDIAFMGISSASPNVKAGKLKALAVTTSKRTPAEPQLPTVAEAGVKGYEFSTWWGVVVPTGTPPEIVDKLAKALAKVVADPQVKERFTPLGVDAEYLPPAEFGPFIKGSIEKYAAIANKAGLKPE